MATFDDRLSAFESSIPKADAPATKEAKPKSVDERLAAFEASIPPDQSFGDKAKDVGISALKGAIGLVDAGVGLADIPTGGRVGKALENEDGMIGLRTKEANQILDENRSERYKWQQKKFQDAEGIGGKLQAVVDEPSIIGHTLVESAPSMLGGAVAARGLGAVGALASNPIVRGAAGEGLVMAGAQEENIRHQTEDGLTTPEQSGLAAATGLMGGLVGYAGGKLTQGLDIDTVLARNAGQAASAAAQSGRLGFAKGVGIPTLSEAGEELVQSTGEQVIQNVALDKPLEEGVAGAAVLGTLAGGAMGAGGGAINTLATNARVREQEQQTPPPSAQPTPEDPTLAPPTESPALELAPIDTNQPSTEQPLAAPVIDQVAPVAPLSADLGIDPAAGSLSEAAALAVDTGAAPISAELQANRDAQAIAATDNADLALQPIAPTLTSAAEQAVTATQDQLTQDQSQVVPTQPAYTSDSFQSVWNTLPSSDQSAIARTAGINEQTVSGNDWQRVSPRDRQQLVDAMNAGVELQDSALAARWDAMTETPEKRVELLVSSGIFANPNVAAKAFAKNRTWDSIPTVDKDKLAPVLAPQLSPQPDNYQSAIETVNPNSSPVVPPKIQLTRTGSNYTVDAKNAPVIAAALGDTVEAGKTYSYPVDQHKAVTEALKDTVELVTPKVTQQQKQQSVSGELLSDIQRNGGMAVNVLEDLARESLKNSGNARRASNRTGTGDLGNMMLRLNEDGYNYQDENQLAKDIIDAIDGNRVLSPSRQVDAIEAEGAQREIEALIADAAAQGFPVERLKKDTFDSVADRIDAMKQAKDASTTPEADAAVEALAPMLSADDKAAIIATPEQAVDALTAPEGIWFNEFLQEWQDSRGNPVNIEAQNERNTAEASKGDTQQIPEGAAEANPVARSNAKADLFGQDTSTAQAIADLARAKDDKLQGDGQAKTDLLGDNVDDVARKQALLNAQNEKNAARNGDGRTEPLTLTGSDSLADEGAAVGQADIFAANAQSENSNDDGITYTEGRGLAKGKWIASKGEFNSGLSDTKGGAKKSLQELISLSQNVKEQQDKIDAAASALAAKIKQGIKPSYADIASAFPSFESNHRYIRQADASWFLTKYLGVPKNKIKANIDKAAGVVTSDSGTKYPIVFPYVLHEVFVEPTPASKPVVEPEKAVEPPQITSYTFAQLDKRASKARTSLRDKLAGTDALNVHDNFNTIVTALEKSGFVTKNC